MSLEKTFEQWLQQLLIDYKNQKPDAEIGEGSLAFIRFACTASALWGAGQYGKYVKNQSIPSTCEYGRLLEWAAIRGITLQDILSENELRSVVLEDFRYPPAGGRKADWERWCKDFHFAGEKLSLTTEMLSASGYLTFSASLLVGLNTVHNVGLIMANPGAYVKITLPQAADCTMILLWGYRAGQDTRYLIQYSDDDINWVTVQSIIPAEYGWNYLEWENAGSHLYWRMVLENSPTQYGGISHIELYMSGSEKVVQNWCDPAGETGRYIDNYMLSNTEDGIPSNGLLMKIAETVDLERNITSKWRRFLAAEVTEVNVSMLLPGARLNRVAIAHEVRDLINSFSGGQALYTAQLLAIAYNNGCPNPILYAPTADVIPEVNQILRAGNVSIS